MKKKNKKSDKNPLPHYYICSDCAIAKGAYLDGLVVATCHEDTCKYCNEVNILMATTDYCWPKLGRRAIFD